MCFHALKTFRQGEGAREHELYSVLISRMICHETIWYIGLEKTTKYSHAAWLYAEASQSPSRFENRKQAQQIDGQCNTTNFMLR